ncbi:MAG TPA: gliding motility-associated C-terminal domain-containing protein, partial [Saprospiraceae bacterium]|nr:gliding motility-associated C-terminal domain-containing protein [Saprospiraceae bacterium]
LHCNLPDSELSGSSPVQAAQYYWTVPPSSTGNIVIGALTPHPTVDAPGVYLLQVTDPQNGCTATDQTVVTQVAPPAFVPTTKKPDCLDPTGAVQFGPVAGGKAPFRYSVDGGQTYSSSPNFSSLKIGTYYLRVQDAYGCEANETVDLQLPFEPTVSLPPLYQIQLGDSVLLLPELNQPSANIVAWQWSPALGLDRDTVESPTAKPLLRSIYTLKIKDKNGCTATARTEIQVNRRRQLYAPNVFSPNGDGHNDRFMIFGKGAVEVRELAIYDRWGNQLYFAEHLPLNDETVGWDGTFRGQPMNPAVFVWRAVVVFIDDEVESYFGDVTVER